MKKDLVLLFIMLSCPACSGLFYDPCEWDTEYYPRYQVSMEYDYGDVVYSASVKSNDPIPNDKVTPGPFYFSRSHGYANFGAYTYRFDLNPDLSNNDDIYHLNCYVEDAKHFEFNRKYYKTPSYYHQLVTSIMSKKGNVIPDFHFKLENQWCQFLPPSNDELAFSFQFGGECLDRESLPDRVYVKVTGQVDIYKKYFEDKGYTSRHPVSYTEYFQ